MSLPISILAAMFMAAPEGSAQVLAPGDRMFELGVATGAFRPSPHHELYDSLSTAYSPYRGLGLDLQLRAAYFPIRYLGAELEAGFMPQANERGDSAQLFGFRGHVVAQLPFRVTPFLLAGGGLLAVKSEGHGDADRAVHWGGGVKIYLQDWLSVRFDLRHIVSASEGPGAGNTNHFEALAGLSFALTRSDDEPELEPQIEFASAPPAVVPVAKAMSSDQIASNAILDALEEVHFAFDSDVIGPNALPAMDRAAMLLNGHKGIRLHIEGYADATGSEVYNLDLSRRRALAIANYLLDRGVSEERISAAGLGESSPVAPNDNAYGRALNRRGEFTLVIGGPHKLAQHSTQEAADHQR